MFDIGWSELLIIAIVAIVVVGPKDLPALLRVAGKWMAKVRRMAAEFQAQVNEAMREAELDEARKTFEDLRAVNPVNMVRDAMEEAARPLQDMPRILDPNAEPPRPVAPAAPDPDIPPPGNAPPVTIGPTLPEVAPPSQPSVPPPDLPPTPPAEEQPRIRLVAGDRR